MEAEYLVTDKSGRSAKPYKLSQSDLSRWDQDECSYNGDTLGEYLEDNDEGDEWESSSIEIVRIS